MIETTHEELATMVRAAVSSGIKDALQDRDALDEFWGSAFAQLQTQKAEVNAATTASGVSAIHW